MNALLQSYHLVLFARQFPKPKTSRQSRLIQQPTQRIRKLINCSIMLLYIPNITRVCVHLECAQQIYTNWKRKIMNGEARNDEAMGKCKRHTHSVGQSIQILILNYFMFLNDLTVAHFHCRICSLMLLPPHYLPHSLHLLGIGWVWAAFRIHLFIW